MRKKTHASRTSSYHLSRSSPDHLLADEQLASAILGSWSDLLKNLHYKTLAQGLRLGGEYGEGPAIVFRGKPIRLIAVGGKDVVMLRLDDFSNEGHILAVYRDDPDDRSVFIRDDLENRRRWASADRELGCVPAMRGLDWAVDDSDDHESWHRDLASDGRKAVAACVCA